MSMAPPLSVSATSLACWLPKQVCCVSYICYLLVHLRPGIRSCAAAPLAVCVRSSVAVEPISYRTEGCAGSAIQQRGRATLAMSLPMFNAGVACCMLQDPSPIAKKGVREMLASEEGAAAARLSRRLVALQTTVDVPVVRHASLCLLLLAIQLLNRYIGRLCIADRRQRSAIRVQLQFLNSSLARFFHELFSTSNAAVAPAQTGFDNPVIRCRFQ